MKKVTGYGLWLAVALFASSEANADSVQRVAGLQPVAENAYIRAPIAGQKNTAAFLVLINPGKQDRVLVGVETSLAGRAELHSHTQVDGMMRMRHEKQLVLPAGQRLELAPGGLHIMLFDITRPVRSGQSVDLELFFADGDHLSVTAQIKSVFDDAGHGHAHH